MKDKIFKKLKGIGEKLLPFAKPFGIRAGIGMALATLSALKKVPLIPILILPGRSWRSPDFSVLHKPMQRR